VGKYLRRTRLDELPQLYNVLKGEMSLVGPRPERPYFVHQLSEVVPFYHLRHAVKPGVTGWAQINYRYGNSVDDTVEKLQYDLFYIKNMSVLLDAYVIFDTIKTVLVRKGS
jgi:lipopolysaccharide/colanic/teichoic acid biosynthesis glycosyltransferase